ncbi:recombinase family protein [Streptomyces inhibens]|uniref:recombinase family protein n=1 Tax=Streptomyces inhibens TaxID=2293571 RepID=UPI00378AAEDA
MHGLDPDPATAPIVACIFTQYLCDKGLFAIASSSLTREGIPSPAAYDRARNPTATAAPGPRAVKAILGNPRYTGRQV